MKCSYCGAPIEKGRLFCLNCGEEIHWVPEYNAISSYRSQTANSTPAKTEPNVSVKAEPTTDTETSHSLQKNKRKKSPLMIGCILMILCLGILLGVKYYMDQKNYNSFDYQINMAETEYSNQQYETAYEFVERAILLNSQSADAVMLKAQILIGMEKPNEAIAVLLDLIEKESDNITAYGQLIRIYENQHAPEKIKELLDVCQSETVLAKFVSYIAKKPVLSLPSGNYDDLVEVELYSSNGENSEIYYTTDGSEPDENSNRYITGIQLKEGTTQIKTVAINEKSITSDLTEGTYHVTLQSPEPPKISPTSGEFTKEMDTQIYVIVPNGCTAYYDFDTKPTKESKQYTGPIEMPEGEHTFYAILINEHGKMSNFGSTTYNLTDAN